MSGQNSELIIHRNAGEDMSTEADYYRRFVRSDGSDTENVIRATSALQRDILGVLVNSPGDDEAADICIGGLQLVMFGGAVEPNDYITTDTVGRAIKWTPDAGSMKLGRYLPPADSSAEGGNGLDAKSGAYGQVLLYPVIPEASPIYATGSIDFAAIASVGSGVSTCYEDVDITVTGAAVGDTVVCTLSTPEPGIAYEAWVSAANVVTVRGSNFTTASINAAEDVYYISVTPRVTHP